MAITDVDSIRKDLLFWSTPIITDLLMDAYGVRLGARQLSTQVLTSVHARLWRVMLQADIAAIDGARKDLLNLATLSKLSREIIDAIDEAVLDELLDVITIRFTRSAELMRDYTRVLLTASANVARMRMLVAI